MINKSDPFVMAAKDWITDPGALPPVTYADIINHLIYGL